MPSSKKSYDKYNQSEKGREARSKYDQKIEIPKFRLNIEQSEKARAKYGDVRTINAKAKELFLAELYKS